MLSVMIVDYEPCTNKETCETINYDREESE